MAISPYLFFDGTCREAMTAYAEIFGGETLAMMTFADAPPGEDMPDVPKELIMHAAIRVGGDLLMASDDAPGRNMTPASTHIHIDLPTFDAAKSAFDRLAEGGEITMPFQKVFWAEGFGTLRDRWGTLWMVSVTSPEA